MINYQKIKKTQQYAFGDWAWVILKPLTCLSIVLIFFAFPCLSVGLQSLPEGENLKKEILYAGDQNYPPFEYLDDKGKPIGFHIDLMRAIAKEMNWDIRFRLDTWHEVYTDFQQDSTIDISNFFFNTYRDTLADFSDAVTIIYHEIVVRKSYPPLELFGDLKGKTVVVQENSFLEEYLKYNMRDINVVTAPSEPEALQLVSKGKYDCAIVNHFIAELLTSEPQYDNLTTTGPPLIPRELGFVVHEGDSVLLNEINYAIDLLKAKGEFSEIYAKWFAVPSADNFTLQKLLKWLIAAFIVLVVLAIVIFLWIRSLRRAVELKTQKFQNELEERQKANLKLIESQVLLKDAQLLAGLGSWSYDPEQDLMSWFDEISNVTCYQVEESEMFKPSRYLKSIHKDDKAKFVEVFENAKLGKIYKSFEFRSYSKDKELLHLSMTTHPIYDQDHKLVKVVGIIQDITERKRSELEMKTKNDELVKINNELDRFVYSLSHDIKAPIASVSGLISVMKLDLDDPKAEIYIPKIENSISKLQTFINDILNYSRNIRVDVSAEPVDFEEIITTTYELLHYIKGAEEIELITGFDTVKVFYSDAYRLKIIFNNIFSNAIKYHDCNKEKSFIKVNVNSNEQEAVITIEDNGQGISKEHLNRIFEMFYRATEKSSGAGLGLYIVKEVVDRLKGTISLDSTIGVGTKITIRIPNLLKIKDSEV